MSTLMPEVNNGRYEICLTPTIICESAGRQAEDAMIYRDVNFGLLRGKQDVSSKV